MSCLPPKLARGCGVGRMRIRDPKYECPQLAISLSTASERLVESWLTFPCTEHEFIISPPEGTGPREIHRSLGDVRMTKRQCHRLDWLDLFPVIERHQFP